MSKCGKCKYKQYLSRYFDIHIDWRDCPRRKECEKNEKIY